MSKRLSLLAGLVLILSACTTPDDQFDYIESTPVTITASPLNAKVGEAVEVTLAGNIGLNERSRVPERPISDITLGVCFAPGGTVDDNPVSESHGLCNNEIMLLPTSFQMLNVTEYYEELDDVVVRRGEKLEYNHSFTFTLSEAKELVLVPELNWRDEFFEGPSGSSNIEQNFPKVTFE